MNDDLLARAVAAEQRVQELLGDVYRLSAELDAARAAHKRDNATLYKLSVAAVLFADSLDGIIEEYMK